MLTRHLRTLTAFLSLAVVAVTGGCDLNPQPLPPGVTPTSGPGATEDAGGATVATPVPGSSDAGTAGLSSDASFADGGGPSAPSGDADAGGADAADAADAGESDAAEDAPSDAAEDAG